MHLRIHIFIMYVSVCNKLMSSYEWIGSERRACAYLSPAVAAGGETGIVFSIQVKHAACSRRRRYYPATTILSAGRPAGQVDVAQQLAAACRLAGG
jgi:hypothetical protein